MGGRPGGQQSEKPEDTPGEVDGQRDVRSGDRVGPRAERRLRDLARPPDVVPDPARRTRVRLDWTARLVRGATFIAHWRAKERLELLKDPHTVLPDSGVSDGGRTIKLGDTVLELTYHGLNHSDTTLVMRLPKEKIIFVVDTLPVGSVPGRGMIDFHPLETEAFMKEVLTLDWERLIPGHPGPGDRLGTKKDVQDQLQLLQTASAEMKKLAQDGKCWDTAEKEFKLSGYEKWPGYANNLQFIARRYCGLWGRGT
jgi:hypothetical protein